MNAIARESLLHDPIHGYIPFVSIVEPGETAERSLIDHPWLQRMRQIHQLQTAWWVYPSAEHTRFQHVVGTMHMASRAVAALYDSLKEVCPDAPSRGLVECTMRLAALLHDVGHGPFGHFFDAHFLGDFKTPSGERLTHEGLGAHIIRTELGEMIRGVRRSPNSVLEAGERVDPEQVAWLIQRPKESSASGSDDEGKPRWLVLLRGLFCGLYTVDNMDFVLRDAYMSGYSQKAYDLDRLLRYSFFSERGLTIHPRGMNALLRFMQTKSELFRAVYFHRTVRAIDKTLEGLFRDSKHQLFPGNPLEHLRDYRDFTEWSLLVDVAQWHKSENVAKRAVGERWQRLLARQVDWEVVTERNLLYGQDDAEAASIFSNAGDVERAIRRLLPRELTDIEMQIDLPRHIYRPHARKATAGQNFLFVPATGGTRPLTDDQLFRHLPVAHRFCRIYLRKDSPRPHAAAVAAALDELVGAGGEDDLTNM